MKSKLHNRLLACAFSLSASAISTQVHSGAFVHLFEWQWDDIASECENHLAPAGYSAVQVSPPQHSIDGSQWWTRYQPLSYQIQGRSGDRNAFASMVSRCQAVGVDIYVDAVINHMAALDRNFPLVPFGSQDFHECTDDINYGDAWSIQNCDLVGLNDLKTESDYVRGKIADYMNDLIGLGVAGFRIDAAKHMPAADVQNIVSRLNGNPYIFQEVIGAGGEPITPQMYTHIGDVTEFNYTNTIGHYFKGRGPLSELQNIGVWGGWLASEEAVVFVANHDNQRQNTANTITHKDGTNVNQLAHIFTLAWPYGYPKVMSSYDWSDHDQGPPGSGASACNNGWLCEHRQREIANMVGFRNWTDGEPVQNQWTNAANGNQMAFGRGNEGFVVINGDRNQGLQQTLYTGLPEGEYCDVIHADFIEGQCHGASIAVDANGMATFSLNATSASALYTGAMIDGEPGGECVYNSMYLRGTFNTWSSQPMSCNEGLWETTVTFSADGRFKFDAFADWSTNWGDANADGMAGAGEADMLVAAGAYTISFNDASLSYTVLPEDVSGGDVSVNFTCDNGYTYPGQSVYVVGDHPSLGSWSPADAVKLEPNAYPSWSGAITLPEQTSIAWKCLKRDESNPAAGVEWQGGANNAVQTAAGANASASF